MTNPKKVEDGGPAFARPDTFEGETRLWEEGHPGMSLRDYFAGQALQGILAYPYKIDGEETKYADVVARLSYQYANAMLKARADQ
jgi:hypothetical protein